MAASNREGEATGQALPSWLSLTKVERYLIIEAYEESTLVDALNGWVGMPDAPYWNRKGKFVPELADAAKSLVEMGLIEVWKNPTGGIGEARLLLLDSATAVVTDPTNWWQYDPTDEEGATGEEEEPAMDIYTLFVTDIAQRQYLSGRVSNRP